MALDPAHRHGPEGTIHLAGAFALALFATLGTRLILFAAGAIQALSRGLPFGEGLRIAALDPLNLALAQGAAFGAALFLGLRSFAKGLGLRRSLVLRPVSLPILGVAIVAGLALHFPLAEIGNLLRELRPMSLEEQLRLRQLLTADGLLDALGIVLAVVVVAPVVEESLFRGLLLRGLGLRYRIGAALVGSSLLFGLAHVEPVSAAVATLGGFVLGAVAIRTRSTYPAIGLHAAFNAVPVMLPERVLPIRGVNVVSEEVQHLPLPLLVGSGIVATASLLLLLWLSEQEVP